MAPAISLLSKSLRSNANQDQGSGYESKPSTNGSCVSSLTTSIVGPGPVINQSPREIDIVKRSISQDVTLETEVESVDLKDSLGSTSGSVLSVRRLGSSDSRSDRNELSIRRKFLMQDETMRQKEEKEEIDTSVSSITLESDIRLYHKTKSKSFHDIISESLVSRSRSMSRNRRKSSINAAGSHSLERIREESSRFTAVASVSSCSQLTEKEPASLTLTELESAPSESKERPSNRFDKLPSPFVRYSHDESSDLNNSSISNFDLSPHKKQYLQLSRGDQSTASTESYLSTETLEVISSLYEANIENESIISKLEHELSALEHERNALITSSDKMMQAMKDQETQLRAQLKRERKGFANASAAHKKEMKVWMDKASALSTKVLDLEQQAQTREVDDEVRAERIINLETNMAKLFVVYSANSSNESANEEHQTNISEEESCLRVFDTVNSETQNWMDKYNQLKRYYDELVVSNKRQRDEMQSEIRELKATVDKQGGENILNRTNSVESNCTCNDDLLNKICYLVDENTLLVERCQEFELLKEENNSLQKSLNEATNFAEAAQKSIDDLKSENAALEEELELERNACEYLRQESCQSECIDDLREANDKLAAGLEEKNDAMLLIKAEMESLKADKQSIKETVVKLRMENLKLQNEKEESQQAKPRPPPPPHPTYMKEKADLEARLYQIEKENADLKETNQGLAARICMLVDFIKEMKITEITSVC